jgi:hypothetical protein
MTLHLEYSRTGSQHYLPEKIQMLLHYGMAIFCVKTKDGYLSKENSLDTNHCK